jgi:hypothetical protein
MKKLLPLLLILLFVWENLNAQVGGDHIYEFLNLSNSARVTSLAGNLITVKDDDVALAYSNPSLLNSKMHQALSFNYNFHLSDIGNGYFGYAHHLKKQDLTLHGGLQYISYGKFDLTDNLGISTDIQSI